MNDWKTNKILIVTSVEQEREALLQGLGDMKTVDIAVVGVGSISAGIATSVILSKRTYKLVINVGIAGGFSNRVKVGGIVLANQCIAADLGAETPDGFIPLEKLGLGETSLKPSEEWVKRSSVILRSFDPVVGPVLTVSTVTGSLSTAAQLLQRYPLACAEAMEGFGVAKAAYAFGIPMIELRVISNEIGIRERESWKIHEALDRLTLLAAQVKENVYENNDFALSE